VLVDTSDPPQPIAHPRDSKRKRGQPRIFIGPIASANKLLKSASERDELRDRFGVKAVEMEGSGIADAAWSLEKNYFVIRGICDYCDGNKNDEWQMYAAVVAAAYTRALLESIPS
jgi:nucleoside phosphorylase